LIVKYKTKCQKSKLTALSKILVLTFVLWKLNIWLTARVFWVLNLYSISINLDFKTWKPSSSHQSSRPKHVGGVTCIDRGQNIVACCAMSVSGLFITRAHFNPLRTKPSLIHGGSSGSSFVCSNSVCPFVIWLTYVLFSFLSYIQNHTLIIMDNDSSHCKENIVVLLLSFCTRPTKCQYWILRCRDS
jgi:hypothetical protein